MLKTRLALKVLNIGTFEFGICLGFRVLELRI